MKLTEKIHLLQIDFELILSPEKKLPRFVNVILIFGEKITLIDTGVKGSEEKIFDYIRQHKRSVNDIGRIILSHSHPDHIGSAARIREITGCKILAHKAEAGWIKNIEKQNKERPVPGFFSLVDRSARIDAYLESGQKIKAAKDITLEIIHAPGHSKGSVNILFREDHILFTADSLPLKNDIPNYDNFREILHTLNSIKENEHYRVLLTSWTPPLTNFKDIERLIREGEDYLHKIDNAVNEIYGGDEPEPLMFCRRTVKKLGLPPFLAMPVVDNAFRSHFKENRGNAVK